MNKRPRSAAEVAASNLADPAFIERQRQRDADLERREAEYRVAERPLVAALSKVGLHVDSVWDLVNTADSYVDALPTLVEQLRVKYPDRVREGIARALAVRQARAVWPELVAQYLAEPDGSDAKAGLAAALSAASDNTTISELAALAADARHGESRVLLLGGLSRSRHPEARAALQSLTGDPEVGPAAQKRLGRART